MTLRVLGGKYKGRILRTPKSLSTRPTTSMIRKAVFDILQASIGETDFLDLFAGCGAMGIEAVSRGASHATFVDKGREAARSIHENIASLQIEDQTTVYVGDVIDILKKLEKNKKRFQVIYADPPYHEKELYDELLSYLDGSSIIAGIVLIETETHFELPPLATLSLIEERRYGSSLLLELSR